MAIIESMSNMQLAVLIWFAGALIVNSVVWWLAAKSPLENI